jgi:hypothetical protein
VNLTGLDAYTWRARVAPILLVVSPMLVLAIGTSLLATTAGAVFGVVTAGLAFLAAELGRDRGRNLQPALWASWGGSPTLQRMRFGGGQDDDEVQRLHEQIEAVTARQLPDRTAQQLDPAGADEAYEAAVGEIRALARGSDFDLLAKENASYGYRRNTLGLRSWGLTVAVVTLGICVVVGAATDAAAGRRFTVLAVPAVYALGAAAFFWWIDGEWVRVPADAYAEQFVGAVRVLARRS